MSEKKRDQNSTRVIVADDHAGVRAGIRRLLESSPDLLVIGEAKDEAPAILVKAVLGVANGEKGWFSQEVVSKISDWHPKTSKS